MPSAARRSDADNESHRILAEIAFFEARILQMGGDGDCAYEKSLLKQYRQLITERRALLRTTPR